MPVCARNLFIWPWLLVLFMTGCQLKEPVIPKVLAEAPFDPGHPVEVVANPQTSYVYFVNEALHVGVFKGLEQIATLDIGEDRPLALAVDEERGWIYVINGYGDSVTVIRDAQVVTTLDIAGHGPRDVAIEPKSGWAYIVTDRQKPAVEGQDWIFSGTVTVVNGTEVIGSISLGEVRATHVVADPINGLVYVGGLSGPVEALQGDVIVLKGLEEVARFTIKFPVTAMSVDPTTGDVFVLDYDLYRFRNGELLDSIDVEAPGGEVINMRVHPVTGDVYVLDLLLQEVVVAHAIDDKLYIVGHAPVGHSPAKMVIDPFTGNVYVANFGDDTVSVIHGTETIATIEVGWYPYGIGVNPANGWVYVSNTNGNTVSILGFEE